MQGFVGAAALFLALCEAAAANDAPQPARSQQATAHAIATFESLDRNADLRLSRSEAGYDRLLSAIFADSDVDGDGFLTPVEYARATGGKPVNM